jgi:trk system potassium uptake protein TrkA
MHIVVVGAGRVGFSLCQRLIQGNHDVSLIEVNEERARHASNRLDCQVFHNEGNSIRALEEADIAKAEALVCVTHSDELNMIICGLAASRYPKLVKVARVRNDEYVRFRETGIRGEGIGEGAAVLGVDHFIHPDIEAARGILNAIGRGALGDVLAFPGSPYELGSMDIAPGSPLDGLPLTDYRKVHSGESLVTMVERDGANFLPDGDTAFAAGDRIHVFAPGDETEAIFKLAGRSGPAPRKIGILGGGQVGTLIAEGILYPERQGRDLAEPFNIPSKRKGAFSLLKILVPRNLRRVVIIEQDYNLCKELSARFPEALVLNEDISDESFVAEERINSLDLIVAATNHQELNIISAVYLKSRGVGRAIAMVSGTGYGIIARQLGVNAVIPMGQVVVDSILSRLIGGGLKGMHRIGDGSIGIFELEVGEKAPVADETIISFHRSSGALLMLASRDGNSFIPRGDYVFKAGDRVMIITKNENEKEVEKLFGVSV